MEFAFGRTYHGALKAVILDWAGTTVDYGCFAPVAAFVQAFAQHGVNITVPQAREPMGLAKKDHVRAIARMQPVSQKWQETHGHAYTEEEVEAIYQTAERVLVNCIADNAELIPGTRETISELRARSLKVGSCTGYTRALMDTLIPKARQQGYEPDAIVCADEVPAGRPMPWMCFRNMQQLGVYPAEAVVKIGDTIPDIEEGLNAGMWTVGVVLSSNEMGLHQSELGSLDPKELKARRAQIEARMRRSGAHYVVADIWDCDAIVGEINARLARGERP